MSRFLTVTTTMFKEEGFKAFYKGILPRVLRVGPGQAVVFVCVPAGSLCSPPARLTLSPAPRSLVRSVYERVKMVIDRMKSATSEGPASYEE